MRGRSLLPRWIERRMARRRAAGLGQDEQQAVVVPMYLPRHGAVGLRRHGTGPEERPADAAWLARLATLALRWSDALAYGGPRRVVTTLTLLHLAIFLPLVVGVVLVRGDAASGDLPIFNERAAALLAGDLAMTSTEIMPTDAPPLVNFLFVPALLLGGGRTAYAAYFSLWPLLTALILYLGLRSIRPRLAVGAAILVITHPTSWVTAAIMAQDEVLVGPFLALVLVTLMRAQHGTAALWTGIGTLVKAWPVVAAPLLLAGATGLRGRGRVLAAGVVPTLLLAVPFFLLAPDYLPSVARFYGGGVPAHRDIPTGMAFWRYLGDAGLWLGLPALLGLLLIGSAVIWWQVARRRIHPVAGFGLAYVVFFLFYPKLHLGYYQFLLIALLPLLVARPAAGLLLLVLGGLGAAGHVLRLYPVPGLLATLEMRIATAAALLACVALAGAWAWRFARSGDPLVADAPPDGDHRALAWTLAIGALGGVAALVTAAGFLLRAGHAA